MGKEKPLPINRELKAFAVKMRKNQTDEENKVWYQILKGRVPKFHRQRIIGNYIVDFCCDAFKIIIELDGGQHYEEKAIEYDNRRSKYLENMGYKVIRFINTDVDYRFDSVCESICQEADRLQRQLCYRH